MERNKPISLAVGVLLVLAAVLLALAWHYNDLTSAVPCDADEARVLARKVLNTAGPDTALGRIFNQAPPAGGEYGWSPFEGIFSEAGKTPAQFFRIPEKSI